MWSKILSILFKCTAMYIEKLNLKAFAENRMVLDYSLLVHNNIHEQYSRILFFTGH